MAMTFEDEQVNDAIDDVIRRQRGRKPEKVTYTDVFESAGLPAPRELHHGGDSASVTAFMKRFHELCKDRRLPPLDALVVHKGGTRARRPGGGYFTVNGHVDSVLGVHEGDRRAGHGGAVVLAGADREDRGMDG